MSDTSFLILVWVSVIATAAVYFRFPGTHRPKYFKIVAIAGDACCAMSAVLYMAAVGESVIVDLPMVLGMCAIGWGAGGGIRTRISRAKGTAV